MALPRFACVMHKKDIAVLGGSPWRAKASEKPFYTDVGICRPDLIGWGPCLIAVEKRSFRGLARKIDDYFGAFVLPDKWRQIDPAHKHLLLYPLDYTLLQKCFRILLRSGVGLFSRDPG